MIKYTHLTQFILPNYQTSVVRSNHKGETIAETTSSNEITQSENNLGGSSLENLVKQFKAFLFS